MRLLRNFHHYKVDEIGDDDRISFLERSVVDTLLQSKLEDPDRESSISFELKHSSNVTQFARLLAHQRHLDVDVCAAGSLLHDIYVIVTGKYKDHARLGGPIALEMLEKHRFTSKEFQKDVLDIVVNHSDKHQKSLNPYVEFGKDVDVLDCFLYPNAIEFYLANKTLYQMYHYLQRTQKIWNDLNVPIPKSLRLLDYFDSGGLSESQELSTPNVLTLLESMNWATSGSDDAHQCKPEVNISREANYEATQTNYFDLPNLLVMLDENNPSIRYSKLEFEAFLREQKVNRQDIFEVRRGKRESQVESSNQLMDFVMSKLDIDKEPLSLMIWSKIGVIEPIYDTEKGRNRLIELSSLTYR